MFLAAETGGLDGSYHGFKASLASALAGALYDTKLIAAGFAPAIAAVAGERGARRPFAGASSWAASDAMKSSPGSAPGARDVTSPTRVVRSQKQNQNHTRKPSR